jgi:hypothetical protein
MSRAPGPMWMSQPCTEEGGPHRVLDPPHTPLKSLPLGAPGLTWGGDCEMTFSHNRKSA